MSEQVTDSQAAPAGESAAVSDSGVAASAADTAVSSATPTTDTAASTVGDTSPASTRDALDDEYRRFQRAEQEEPPEPEKPVKVEAKPEEKVEEEAAQTASEETDPLAEFEDKPLTRDQIRQKHPRQSAAIYDDYAKSEEHRGQLIDERQAIGGDAGMELAKETMPIILQTPNPTPAHMEAFMNAVDGANPVFALKGGEYMLNKALNEESVNPQTNNPYWLDFANQFLNAEWDGYGHAKIDELVEMDKAGILDDARETMKTLSTPSDSEKAAREETAKLRAEVEQIKGDKRTNAQKEQQRVNDEVDAYTQRQSNDGVLPIFEKVNWAASEGDDELTAKGKLTFGKAMTALLNQLAFETPEYAAIEELKRQGNAWHDGKPTRALIVNTTNKTAREKALAIQLIRDMQPFIKSTSLSSRNAQLANKNGQQTRDPEIPETRQPVQPRAGVAKSTQEELDALYSKYKVDERAIQETAGRV